MGSESSRKRGRTRDRDAEASTGTEWGEGDDESAGFFPDLLRKGLTLGFTGFFMTEEAIRKAMGDSVPKDVIEYVLEQSERMRSEFLERVSAEIGRAAGSMDPVEIARRLLEGRTIEVTARFRIIDEPGGSPAPDEDDG